MGPILGTDLLRAWCAPTVKIEPMKPVSSLLWHAELVSLALSDCSFRLGLFEIGPAFRWFRARSLVLYRATARVQSLCAEWPTPLRLVVIPREFGITDQIQPEIVVKVWRRM